MRAFPNSSRIEVSRFKIGKATVPISGVSEKFTTLNFQESKYKDSTGKKNREYLMTKDGFIFLSQGCPGTGLQSGV